MMTLTYPRPILESYWVIPGQFLAGEYPGRYAENMTEQRIDAFLQAGFTAFIDLTSSGELPEYAKILKEQARHYQVDVSHQRFSISDFGLPTPEKMTEILDTLDSALNNGEKVYLHCWGGIGRTGTVVGCYLVRQGYSGEKALALLADCWQTVPKSLLNPRSPETDAQRAFILNWATTP